MSNYKKYMDLLRAEKVIIEEMNKIEQYCDEWQKLDDARRIIADLEIRFR